MLLAVGLAVAIIVVSVALHFGMIQWMMASEPSGRHRRRLRIVALVLVALLVHLVEITLFAFGLQLLVYLDLYGELEPVADTVQFFTYVYYSAVTYTTLGFGDIVPEGPLRLFTALEALAGLVLSAWTASAIFLGMQRYWERKTNSSN